MWLSVEGLKTFWLLNVHLFLNHPIEEGYLYIHLMYLPFHLRWKCNDGFHWWVPCDWCKGLIIINPLHLREPPDHKFFPVFHNSPICYLLHLVDPPGSYKWLSLWSWDKFPCTVPNNEVILLSHGINQNWLLHCFLKRGWFYFYTFAHKIYVASVPL